MGKLLLANLEQAKEYLVDIQCLMVVFMMGFMKMDCRMVKGSLDGVMA
jgi:hypothetical protein